MRVFPQSYLCYTLLMQPIPQTWLSWAKKLDTLGVNELVASCLEAAGPLTILGAQVLYLGQPLLHAAWGEGAIEELAQTLEDTDQTQAFITLLREVPEK